MGLIEDLTTYLWNWFIWGNVVGGIFGCWMVGGWGIFWDDDDGMMMQKCLDIWGGLSVTFPVEYESVYAPEA